MDNTKHKCSWAWVTTDKIVSEGPAELLYAMLIPSSSATSTATIYQGETTDGKIVVAFRTAESRQAVFYPPEPVRCEQGLFVDVIANVKGVFVQWRELPRNGGEG